jgi:hypothetical protein
MWYVLPDSNKQYPLLIERVKQIKNQNKQNIIPDELGAVEATGKPKEELVNVDLTGQFSLKTLDNADRKKRHNRPGSSEQRRDNRPQQQPRDSRTPQQSRDNRPPQQSRENKPSQQQRDNRPPPKNNRPPLPPRENRPPPPIKKP